MRDPNRRRAPVVFDIETEPDHEWLAATEAEFLASLEPPANYKSGEAIGKWMATKVAERKERAALSSIDGRVVAIAFAPLWAAGEPVARVGRDDEHALLQWFVSALENCGDVQLAGFAIASFDIPFVFARAALHGVCLPDWWPSNPHRYGAVLDAHELLGPRGTLDLWLTRFGLPQKCGSGKDVGQMLDHDLLAYVATDAAVERMLLKRLSIASNEIARTNPNHHGD